MRKVAYLSVKGKEQLYLGICAHVSGVKTKHVIILTLILADALW
jgi:hypothetical protein